MGEALPASGWHAMRDAHVERAHALLADVIDRRTRGERHAVEDFLFDYYNLRPGQLLFWHPGAGLPLEGADEYASRKYYDVRGGVARVDVGRFLADRASTVDHLRTLLEATVGRAPQYHCFGMHEWAMVYHLQPSETRHPGLPLRFAPDEVARVVEEIGCRCTHFDAFRFFTPDAVPLNSLQPTRETQVELEQPACLHANMDLYKAAGKLLPLVDSTLLLDTYELARDIRVLDMAASPYDVSALGYPAVEVDTQAGRATYVAAQRGFATRAQELRGRLLGVLTSVFDPEVGTARV